MALNKTKGNMYEFVTHTWNTVKGKCYHDCKYCYMKHWGIQYHTRFDEYELTLDLGKDNFIFIGSSNDLFSEKIPDHWIRNTIKHASTFKNKYLLQTKNPIRYKEFNLQKNFILGTTIESDIMHECMGNAPIPYERAYALSEVKKNKKFVTIEPILKFNLIPLLELIDLINPEYVNIGMCTGSRKKLKEFPLPSKEEVQELIIALGERKVTVKKNCKLYIQKKV